jgi:hypothetical protein
MDPALTTKQALLPSYFEAVHPRRDETPVPHIGVFLVALATTTAILSKALIQGSQTPTNPGQKSPDAPSSASPTCTCTCTCTTFPALPHSNPWPGLAAILLIGLTALILRWLKERPKMVREKSMAEQRRRYLLRTLQINTSDETSRKVRAGRHSLFETLLL